MNTLILYNYFRSSTSFRVRIALELKGLNYEYRPVHLLEDGGQQNKAQYRELNPMGGVPTLVHDGKIISQSLVILEYLDDAFPQTFQIFPKEIFLKAQVKQFCEIINADLHAFGNLKVLQYLEKNHSFSHQHKEDWVKYWFNQGFISLEKILQSSAKDFCFGNEVTAADILLIPFITTAERYHMDLLVFPNISRIFENCMRRPEFMKAHPFRQVDTPNDLRRT